MDLVVLSGRIVVQVVVETGGPGDGTLLPLVAVGENDTMLIVILGMNRRFEQIHRPWTRFRRKWVGWRSACCRCSTCGSEHRPR